LHSSENKPACAFVYIYIYISKQKERGVIQILYNFFSRNNWCCANENEHL